LRRPVRPAALIRDERKLLERVVGLSAGEREPIELVELMELSAAGDGQSISFSCVAPGPGPNGNSMYLNTGTPRR
jgi:hypothetical protein